MPSPPHSPRLSCSACEALARERQHTPCVSGWNLARLLLLLLLSASGCVGIV